MILQEGLKRLIRFGSVGLLTNSFGYVLFLALIFFGVLPYIASGVSYVVTLGSSYLANRRWTFDSQNSHIRDLPHYLVIYGIGLIIAMASMAVLTGYMHAAIAQVLVIAIVAGFTYICLELTGFG